jgi:putative heme-binding domain-containing protein
MLRNPLLGSLALACLVAALACPSPEARGQAPGEPQWVWFNEGDPRLDAPAETRYFRRVFAIKRLGKNLVDEATLQITADNAYRVWINGTEVGKGSTWETLDRYDVRRHLIDGKNVIAVEARNEGGPAGLVVHLTYAATGRTKQVLVSDGRWKASKTAGKGWQKADYNDKKWSKAKVLGAFGKTAPWAGVAGGKPGPRRFTVPEGFKVEEAVKNPGDRGPFSLVNMTFDAKGRLLVSQENGPILLCSDPDKNGVMQKVRDYCTLVKNSHGMCWVKDALYLVGNGPKGTGLYRCRDTKGADKIDEVTLLHRFNGSINEHGPHAVLHGPDGWLYVVIGNHAFADIGKGKAPNPEKLAANSPLRRWPSGGMGLDQGKKGSTEDVLLPRLNDARGHAANLLAPGGTIWRMDHEGKNMSLVAAGFRNHFDAAFSPFAELFTFDSDMEWDIGLPWYRDVRINHCPPGADFVWRTGAANTPNSYLDSLPPLYETGRGSPVGLEFYDHNVYPKKYRGAFFMADWSLGIIYAVHLKKAGATYKAEVEKFCTGAPMNVTDLEAAPDGAIYFTMGGRGTQGGVYRIVHAGKPKANGDLRVQLLSSWARANRAAALAAYGRDKATAEILQGAQDAKRDAHRRISNLTLLQIHNLKLEAKDLLPLATDKDGDVRAHAIWLLGVRGYKEGRPALLKALEDRDAMVRRRACEALIRAGIEPPVAAIWQLLGDRDHFVRTAARLVLERIAPAKWVGRLAAETNDLIAYHAIIALCKTNQAEAHAAAIYARLQKARPADTQGLLDYARTVQMVLFHAGKPPAAIKDIAAKCDRFFPHTDKCVNRELAIVLTHLKRTKLIDTPVHSKLLSAMRASNGDRPQQIHYFYCLRLIPEGWSAEEKSALASWYESTHSWGGGHSFTPFLENIFRECLAGYSLADRRKLLQQGEKTPLVSLVLAQRLQNDRQPALMPELKALAGRIGKVHREAEVRQAISEAILRTACEHPKDHYADLVAGLSSANKVVLFDVIAALKKSPTRPKADDPRPYRALLLASSRLDPGNRWAVVELLRHWSGGRAFGAEANNWRPELAAWGKWFAQAFPKERPLPLVMEEKPPVSKYKFDDLLSYLTKEGKKGNVARGRLVFEKAQCIKCHKYGKDGEGVGPDLTTLAKRFKRADTLESILYPSKVISDQYRSTTVVTKRGQTITGLLADQPDSVSILLSDGSKVTIRKRDIEQRYASLVSVMPEGLLDALRKEEIADLFAFLESEPPK